MFRKQELENQNKPQRGCGMNIVNRITTNRSGTAEKSAQIIAHNYGLRRAGNQSSCCYQRFEAPYVLMLVDTVGKKDGNLLSNTSKKQVGMECCRIPSFSVGNAKAVLEMVDRLFNSNADFICLIPFLSSPDGAGKGT